MAPHNGRKFPLRSSLFCSAAKQWTTSGLDMVEEDAVEGPVDAVVDVKPELLLYLQSHTASDQYQFKPPSTLHPPNHSHISLLFPLHYFCIPSAVADYSRRGHFVDRNHICAQRDGRRAKETAL